MRRLPRRLAAAALALPPLVGACDSAGPAPTLRTDAVVYTARPSALSAPSQIYEVDVVVRLTNPTGRTIYLERCRTGDDGPIYGVALVGGGESAFGPNWGCPSAPPLEVAPGALRVDTLRLVGPNGFDGVTGEPFGTLAGRHRIVYGYDSARLRSNVFEIRLPD